MFTGVCFRVIHRSHVYVLLLHAIYIRGSQLTLSQNIVLSEKPAITTTISSLPPTLLETLLGELSTLASVYHKPPGSFLGQGRFGADGLQRAAIEEQQALSRDMPIAAAAAAVAAGNDSAVNTTGAQQAQANAENLLDLDFSDPGPAAGQSGSNLPSGVQSPATGMQGQQGTMDDLMGIFGSNDGPPMAANGGMGGLGGVDQMGGQDDLMNGFAGLDMSGGGGQQQPAQPEQKKNNEDILGLF